MSEQVNDSGPMYRPSHDDSQGMDAGTMRMLYLAGFGGVAILVGVAVYSLTGRSGGDVVPTVQADSRPIRVKPENPGGMTVAPEQQRADPNNSRLAPGTEEPNPRALLAIPDPSKVATQQATLPPPRAKSVTVQLSEAKSEAQAQAAWEKMAKKMPEVIGQHRALFQKVNESGPAPWRLRTGGFTDQAQAKAFCDKVKAKGGQCTVVES
jgi:hypothetical protein